MAAPRDLFFDLFARIWNRLGTPLRRNLVWLGHAKFVHGISAIVIDDHGKVLLLKHRFWKRQRWGLPGGLARRGETLSATLRRELREETGLDVRPTKLLQVNTAQGRMTEFLLLAECTAQPRAASPEIMDAKFWHRTELPDAILPIHRELLEAGPRFEDWPGLPLED